MYGILLRFTYVVTIEAIVLLLLLLLYYWIPSIRIETAQIFMKQRLDVYSRVHIVIMILYWSF